MTTRWLDGTERGWWTAVVGLVAAFVGGLFLAQAGGSDRKDLPRSLGYLFCACGLLGILIGGVAIGIRLARD